MFHVNQLVGVMYENNKATRMVVRGEKEQGA